MGAAYCYLLGIYLGDGHLSVRRRAWELCVSLDRHYPLIVGETDAALSLVFPKRNVRRYLRAGKENCFEVKLCHPALGEAFPQHGPGKKHLRKIELVAWQRELTRQHPKALIRGLIHSDGSRCINRFTVQLPSGPRVYAYPRYFFTNMSADIRTIFGDHCKLLGIRWSQSNYKNISISDRKSVALMDSFVGPKA